MIGLQFAAPFAVLVLVPLALSLHGAPRRWLLSLLCTAVVLAGSYAFEPGVEAGLLAVPYAIAAGVVGFLGRTSAPYWYLGLGGVALMLARAGFRLPGYSEAVILLTAIHANYAGVAGSVFAIRTGQALGERATTPLYRVPAQLVFFVPALLTVSIPISPYLESALAFLLSAGMAAISGLALLATLGSRHRAQTLALSVASASAVLGMSSAAVYAASRVGRLYWLPTPELAVVHGYATGIGFCLIGLLAWLIEPTKSTPDPALPASLPRHAG